MSATVLTHPGVWERGLLMPGFGLHSRELWLQTTIDRVKRACFGQDTLFPEEL